MRIPVRWRPLLAAVVAASLWAWPLAPPHQVVRPFIPPIATYGAGHRGIDIAAAVGSPVRAPAAGVVHFAGTVAGRPVLSIDQGGGILSSYEPVVASVAAGDPVARGQVIGVLAAGHCSAGCLHFGVRVGGVYVNPMLFLGGVPRAVLLPVRRGAGG